ncbi:MAG: type II toxin-antitoxin system VapC family toxin [Acidobacteriota bacterium]|nr:type II toxin-antitoxin system VapC family toxin [Acidobacteriota bacterium]
MYPVDTNIWLERLLAQAKSDEVRDFLHRVPASELFITDFAFHSICVVLTRLRKEAALLKFVEDVFIDGAVTLVFVPPEETGSLIDAMSKFNLDFDDAYQYVAAEKQGLVIVSFDADFNRTARGKKTPAEILAGM